MNKQCHEYHSTREPLVFTSQAEAVAELAKMDHAFVTEAFVRGVCAAFGVKPQMQSRRVDSTEFKGLNKAWDDEGNELPDGTMVFGADAASLACRLCDALGLTYMSMYGRGSQLRACVDALAKHLQMALVD